jgi:hypothetical protein
LPVNPEVKLGVCIIERRREHVILEKAVIPFTCSLPLCNTNRQIGDGKHRHVAVWASNNEGMSPGSFISSNRITMERVDLENSKSRYKPKYFDMTIALTIHGQKSKWIFPLG